MSLHTIRTCLLMLAVACAGRAQAPSTRFDPLLENRQVSVFSLDLPPRHRAPLFQNTHDVIWVALTSGRAFIFDRDGDKQQIELRPGEARFFPSFRVQAISNEGAEPVRGVLIQIKARGLASSCDCDGAAERAVCGCARAAPLPALWAVGIGSVVLGGTELEPGQSFHHTSERGDMLLVAISNVNLSDDAGSAAAEANITLRTGEVWWLDRGLHKLRNRGSAAARYVTLEF